MQLNENGLALLRSFEGFRATAYKCPAGVWTIGYGHTGRAGPPAVTPDSRMDEETARKLLETEARSFGEKIKPSLQRKLNDDQFSALVSFAFNVGIGNFRKSSVLAAVNSGDDAAVARRLGLWVKASGKTLPGLVRRRAAEAALYLSTIQQTPQIPVQPEAPRGKPMLQSTTNIAAGVSAIAGTTAAASSALRDMADIFSNPLMISILMLLIAGSLFWILRERWLKSKQEGV